MDEDANKLTTVNLHGTPLEDCEKREKSSNINEVIRSVLNFLIFFTKRFHKYKKAHNRLQRTKIKNVYKKYLSSNINEVIKTI